MTETSEVLIFAAKSRLMVKRLARSFEPFRTVSIGRWSNNTETLKGSGFSSLDPSALISTNAGRSLFGFSYYWSDVNSSQLRLRRASHLSSRKRVYSFGEERLHGLGYYLPLVGVHSQ